MAAIRRVTIFNGAAPGADTNILSANITPKPITVLSRIGVAFGHSAKLNLMGTDGTTTYAWALNEGSNLAADTLYKFEFTTDPSLSYNLQISHNGVVEQLTWDDIVERA